MKIMTEILDYKTMLNMDAEMGILLSQFPAPFFESLVENGVAEYAMDEMKHLGYNLPLVGKGSDRVAYRLDDNWVLKIERAGEHYQSQTEYNTYTLLDDKEHLTTILSSPLMASYGLVIAEYVQPMYDYLHGMLPLGRDTDQEAVAIEDFHASEGSDNLYYEAGELLGDDVFGDIETFIHYVAVNELEDMYTDNIGVRLDGTFVALDIGLGSSMLEEEDLL